MRCNTHYQRFTTTHFKITNSATILFQHPHAILLRLVNGTDPVAVAQHLHVEVGECLVRSVIFRAHETVELAVIEVNKPLLELR